MLVQIGRRLLDEVMNMSKIEINEDKFIEICNNRLKEHPQFEEGMKIVGIPSGVQGSDLSGYDWEGPKNMPGIVSEVVNEVEKEYVLSL